MGTQRSSLPANPQPAGSQGQLSQGSKPGPVVSGRRREKSLLGPQRPHRSPQAPQRSPQKPQRSQEPRDQAEMLMHLATASSRLPADSARAPSASVAQVPDLCCSEAMQPVGLRLWDVIAVHLVHQGMRCQHAK